MGHDKLIGSNAVTEGCNSKTQSIKSAARSFRSCRNYRIRILFFCGKLNLYPLRPSEELKKERRGLQFSFLRSLFFFRAECLSTRLRAL